MLTGVGQGSLGAEDSRGKGTAYFLILWREGGLQKVDILRRNDDLSMYFIVDLG